MNHCNVAAVQFILGTLTIWFDFLLLLFALCGCKLRINIIPNEICPSYLVYQTNLIKRNFHEIHFPTIKFHVWHEEKLLLSCRNVAIFCNWVLQSRKWTFFQSTWDWRIKMQQQTLFNRKVVLSGWRVSKI